MHILYTYKYSSKIQYNNYEKEYIGWKPKNFAILSHKRINKINQLMIELCNIICIYKTLLQFEYYIQKTFISNIINTSTQGRIQDLVLGGTKFGKVI